jgi:hypothetical protein
LNDLNRELFLALNGSPTSPRIALAFAIFAAKYLIVLVPLHLVLIWLGGDRKMRFVGVTAFLALVIAIGINQAIGYVAFTPRPFVVGLGTQLIEHRDSSSLPSNHATIFFTYAAVLLLLSKRALGLVFGLLGLLVDLSGHPLSDRHGRCGLDEPGRGARGDLADGAFRPTPAEPSGGDRHAAVRLPRRPPRQILTCTPMPLSRCRCPSFWFGHPSELSQSNHTT